MQLNEIQPPGGTLLDGYGPGGFRFTDYVKVGTPLQLLFAVVTTLGIAAIYGV